MSAQVIPTQRARQRSVVVVRSSHASHQGYTLPPTAFRRF
jgi:hypothetical protein